MHPPRSCREPSRDVPAATLALLAVLSRSIGGAIIESVCAVGGGLRVFGEGLRAGDDSRNIRIFTRYCGSTWRITLGASLSAAFGLIFFLLLLVPLSLSLGECGSLIAHQWATSGS